MSTPTPETAEIVEATTAETTETDVESTDVTPEGADALGDAGKKALDTMKSKWHSERDKRRELEDRIAALEAPKNDTTDQPDADTIRREATREATAKANARILRSEIKAAATGKLENPAVALKLIDLDQFEVDENGDIDAEEISDAINTLIENEPYLAAATAPRFQGTGDGGAARKASGPSQITRDAMARMSPEQIVKAKSEGRLNTVLGTK